MTTHDQLSAELERVRAENAAREAQAISRMREWNAERHPLHKLVERSRLASEQADRAELVRLQWEQKRRDLKGYLRALIDSETSGGNTGQTLLVSLGEGNGFLLEHRGAELFGIVDHLAEFVAEKRAESAAARAEAEKYATEHHLENELPAEWRAVAEPEAPVQKVVAPTVPTPPRGRTKY